MMQAGNLRDRISFFEIVDARGQAGERGTERAMRYEANAHIRYLRGSEAVIAARLEGKQPVVITIRSNSQSRAIKPDWIAHHGRRETDFNIRSIVESDCRHWLEITAESGVTT